MTRAATFAALRWTGILLAALILLLIVLFAILDWKADELRGPIARAASARLGTTVRIDDHLELHLLSFHPYVIVNGIAVANPPWVGHGDLARIGRLTVQMELAPLLRGAIVLPLLKVENADIDLIRDASDHANWRLTQPQGKSASSRPPRLPVVRSFSLHGAHFNYEDGTRQLKLTSTVTADESKAGGGSAWARLNGKGVANGEPFNLAVIGQPLLDIRVDEPYALTFAIRAARTNLNGKVTLAKAFDLASLRLDFAAAGEDLADLYHLTRLALPNTAPYRLTGHIYQNGTQVQLTDLSGKMGSSDLRGTITVETANKRPALTANLSSQSLNLSDVAPAFGTRVPGARTRGSIPEGKAPAAPKNKTDASAQLLFPNAQLDPQRIRGMDADVHYHADSVQAQKIPFKHVALHLKLDNGVLSVDPVSLTLAEGRVDGTVRMDARDAVPNVSLDVRLTNVRLSQFHAKGSEPAMEGTLVGRALLHGHGASPHAVAATVDGTVVVVVPQGNVRSAFAELTGINVASGLGLLLTKNQQAADIRCGVAQFQSDQGTLVAKSIVFDTQNVLITGKGEIDLGSEQLDLDLSGQPKHFRLVRVRAPIAVRGTLLHPSIGVKPGNTIGQGAAAVTLGTLLTPVAAVLAFIDPGLGKDANCSALMNEAHQQGAPLKTARASPGQPPPQPQAAPPQEAAGPAPAQRR
jgi:uncharacterized protein involved in outer membrane biogenesis